MAALAALAPESPAPAAPGKSKAAHLAEEATAEATEATIACNVHIRLFNILFAHFIVISEDFRPLGKLGFRQVLCIRLDPIFQCVFGRVNCLHHVVLKSSDSQTSDQKVTEEVEHDNRATKRTDKSVNTRFLTPHESHIEVEFKNNGLSGIDLSVGLV